MSVGFTATSLRPSAYTSERKEFPAGDPGGAMSPDLDRPGHGPVLRADTERYRRG